MRINNCLINIFNLAFINLNKIGIYKPTLKLTLKVYSTPVKINKSYKFDNN